MEAIWLARTAELLGWNSQHDFPHLRAICVAGEFLSTARKERLAALWQTEVYNLYGCTEAGNMAADCPAGRLHLSWDHFLMEVVDESTGAGVAAGELGSAVVTTLTRGAMPLLRYALGDSIRLIADHQCPCGRTAPLLEHLGRDLNRFVYLGREYRVADLEPLLLQAPVAAFGNIWLLEVRPDQVRCRVEAAAPDLAVYHRLEARIAQELGLPLQIEPVAPGTLLISSRLLQIAPVGKPRIIGYPPGADARPLTFEDLL
jgi:phenylacetate-CoA ligase